MDRIETKQYKFGQPANFTLDHTPVPALSIEEFDLSKATENYERVRHTIAKVQASRRIEALEQQFSLEANIIENNYSETRGDI